MRSQKQITIKDFFNTKSNIINLLNSINQDNKKELEFVFSKFFPYGKIKIFDLFQNKPLHKMVCRQSVPSYPQPITFYNQNYYPSICRVFILFKLLFIHNLLHTVQ
jgi:hypothetical protein